MAELAIPLIALGGLYVISNHDKEDKNNSKEPFTQNVNSNSLSQTYSNPPINYPVTKKISNDNPMRYKNPNQTTDKFFNNSTVETIEQNNPRDSVGGSTRTTLSLTGDPINKNDFKHNNMVPFFGAKIKGATASADIAQTRMDNMQGAGSQHRSKVEQAPLFKPQANMSWSNGMPSTTDFMMSRQMPGTKMNNVKPWDEEKVAPGLGHGFTTTNSGAGYNVASEDRNAWLPKTVDNLRTSTNPKMSFSLQGQEGPATYYVKEYGNLETQGKIEKNRPDTDYNLGPDRWFTTTGVEKGPTVRSKEMLQHTNRPDYAETDYYGAGAKEGQATYINSYNNNSHRQQLDAPGISAPKGKIGAATNDYGNGSYYALCNNRSTTKNDPELGPLQGLIKAATAPVLDVLRPTRKQNVVGSVRPSGNVQQTSGSSQPIYNPADRTKTTIREQTENSSYHLYVQGQNDGAYTVTSQQPIPQERDTTNVHNYGSAYGNTREMSQTSNYNQINNPNKTFLNTPNQGGMSLLNSNVNVSLRSDSNVQNNRSLTGSASVTMIPSVETYGDLNTPQTYNNSQGCDRINPDILSAFKNNPYTQSLSSWA
jgi:hypothetical protein